MESNKSDKQVALELDAAWDNFKHYHCAELGWGWGPAGVGEALALARAGLELENLGEKGVWEQAAQFIKSQSYVQDVRYLIRNLESARKDAFERPGLTRDTLSRIITELQPYI